MKPIQMMVIGVGGWGQNWISSLLGNQEYKIVALVDEMAGRAKENCAKYGLATAGAFRGIEDAIQQCQPEAAVITVPPAAHYNIAMKCMEAGLHILSEKPLANDLDEAYSLLNMAVKQNITFMVSQDYRFQPPVRTLHDLIAEGRIGDPGYISYRHYKRFKLGGWREEMEQVILEDMAIHHFDLLRYLLGKECLSIYSDTFNPKWSWYRSGAVANVQLVFEDDIHVEYLGTWVTSGWDDETTTGEIRIEGSLGSALLHTNGTLQIWEDGTSKEVPLQTMASTGRAYSLQEFLMAVRQGLTAETDIKDNINSFIITRAALKANDEKRLVNISELRKAV